MTNLETIQTSSEPAQDTSHIDEPANLNKPSEKLTKFQLTVVILFAWCGTCSLRILLYYPAAFYLKFLQDRNLDKTYGTIALSTAMATMLISPYIARLSRRWRQLSLWVRALCAILGNMLSNIILGSVDAVMDAETSGTATYFLIGTIRAFQGASMGILFVAANGEIIDIFFKNDSFVISIISSASHVAGVVGSNVAAQTYPAGGWTVTGPAIATFNIIPLLFIPLIRSYENSEGRFGARDGDKESGKIEEEELKALPKKEEKAPRSLTTCQTVVLYLPDLAVFVNSVTFNMVTYVLPLRAVNFNDMTLERAVLIISIIYAAGFLSSFPLAYLAAKKVNTFAVLIALTNVYYLGFVLIYGATTDFMGFPYAFETGALLVGIGNAGHMNLCVVSQFTLYEKWGMPIGGADLGKNCSAVFNVMIACAAMVGVIVSGLPASRASEVPTLVYLGVAYLVAATCFVTCKVNSAVSGRGKVAPAP